MIDPFKYITSIYKGFPVPGSLFRVAGLALIIWLAGCGGTPVNDQPSGEEEKPKPETERIRLDVKRNEDRVDIFFEDRLFTSYRYSESFEKPVLYPIHTASGIEVTRGYPLEPRPWERVDHPHHMGLWLNHGNVNDLDFWNNSDSIPEARRMSYGTIFHRDIEKTRNGDKQAVLEITAAWRRPDGRTLLDENTRFIFSGEDNYRIIDRITTLTASKTHVLFKDSKEGMLAVRVARELEQPAEEPVTVLNENLERIQTDPQQDNRSNGKYVNSEGQTGDEVWGKRARWVKLAGTMQGQPTGIVIMDHPDNPNHPGHWHARGYGLFGVNPFGSKAYTNGRESFNFFLAQYEQVTLKYRILIYDSSEPESSVLNQQYDTFVNTYKEEDNE